MTKLSGKRREKLSKVFPGSRYSSLVAVKFFGRGIRGKALWEWQCDCGKTKVIREDAVKSGSSRSCGCYQSSSTSKRMTVHGLSRSPEYTAWEGMIGRCYNVKDKAFKNYGGRGISVCERWHNPVNFIYDMGDKPAGHSLDRVDNSSGYGPENCRWATPKQQSRNTRWNVRLTHPDGRTLCIAEWAEQLGVSPSCIHTRYARGWTDFRTLTTPVQTRRRKLP